MKTTNYYNTFIETASDCPAASGEIPPQKNEGKSVAALQYELLKDHPYQYTSDDVLFSIFASRNNIPNKEQAAARQQFFSKGQPCLRCSPLAKRYGWGFHSNAEGKVAIYAKGSPEYKKLLAAAGKTLTLVSAMRSAKK